MGNFRQLSQELWLLIVVKSLFPPSILSIFDRFSTNLVSELMVRRSGIVDG